MVRPTELSFGTTWVDEDELLSDSSSAGSPAAGAPPRLRARSSRAQDADYDSDDMQPLRRSYAFCGRGALAGALARRSPEEHAERVIRQLPRLSGGGSGDSPRRSGCCVCFETSGPASPGPPPEASDSMVRTPCGHCFHAQCLLRWAVSCHRQGRQLGCPNCRASIGNSAES
eukprot:TRINITY_DN7077_c0_g1_i3.p2 TRINITY_DN7077_c0_g1~~TRINITY_DN7077_c0_g1_i3.p2  ORF type:complete len:172 (+),score=25.50 TRINITY_DN7077_c0_g1_i3:81-596(+)